MGRRRAACPSMEMDSGIFFSVRQFSIFFDPACRAVDHGESRGTRYILLAGTVVRRNRPAIRVKDDWNRDGFIGFTAFSSGPAEWSIIRARSTEQQKEMLLPRSFGQVSEI